MNELETFFFFFAFCLLVLFSYLSLDVMAWRILVSVPVDPFHP